MGALVSVDACELQRVITTLRAGGRELTHLGIEVTQGMPAMNPILEYEVYHELRNIGLRLEKLGRELCLDAAAQEMRLVAFGQADGMSPVDVLRLLVDDIAWQGVELSRADCSRQGVDGLMNPIDRAERFGEGLAAFGAGVVGTASQLVESTTTYGLIDREGQQRAFDKDARILQTAFKTTVPYMLWDPEDAVHTDALLAYSLAGGQYIWEGDPDKWAGYVAPQAILAVLTEGESEAAVVPAEAANPLTDVATVGVDITAGASRAVELADAADVSFLIRGSGVTGGADRPLLGLKDAWNAFSNLVTVNTTPRRLPWDLQPVPVR